MEDLKNIFNIEMDKALLDIDKCLVGLESGKLEHRCGLAMEDILHKIKGMLFQAKLDDAAILSEKQEKFFEDISRKKMKMTDEILTNLRKDMALVKEIYKAFIDSEEEIVL